MTESNRSNASSTDGLGRLDDAQEDSQQSSTTGGPAAEGEYDPAQGSPGHPHPTGPGIAADPDDIGVSDS